MIAFIICAVEVTLCEVENGGNAAWLIRVSFIRFTVVWATAAVVCVELVGNGVVAAVVELFSERYICTKFNWALMAEYHYQMN